MVFFTEHSQSMFFMIPGSPSSPEIHMCSGTIMIFLSELPELGALPFWVWAGGPPFQTTIRKKGLNQSRTSLKWDWSHIQIMVLKGT